MGTKITGQLPAHEVDRIAERRLFEARFWSADSQVHLFRTTEFSEPDRGVFIPKCAEQVAIPRRWAFPRELSEITPDELDHLRKCPGCWGGA
jgi:hypothetical protein